MFMSWCVMWVWVWVNVLRKSSNNVGWVEGPSLVAGHVWGPHKYLARFGPGLNGGERRLASALACLSRT